MLLGFGFGSWTLRLLLTRRRSLFLALRWRLRTRGGFLFSARRRLLLLARRYLLFPLRRRLLLLARGGLRFAGRRAGVGLSARRGVGGGLGLTGGVAFGSRGGAIWLRWLRGGRSGLVRANLIRVCFVGTRIRRIGAGGVRLRCIRLRFAGANLVRRSARGGGSAGGDYRSDWPTLRDGLW